MKSSRKNGLSDFQLIAVVFVAASGASITFLPRPLAEEAGRDGWIGIALAGLLALVAAALIYLLCRRFPRRILPEFSMLILGKPLGILVSAAYIVYTLFLGGTTLILFIELSKTWSMFWTPQWFLTASLFIPVVYIVRQGPVPLGRLMELVIYSVIFIVLLLLLNLPQLNSINLRPVGEEGLTAIMGAAGQMSFSFLGFEVLLVFFPLIVNRDRILFMYLLAVTLLIGLYTLVTLFTHSMLGVELIKLHVWPLMEYLSAGRIQFIERIDNLFLFLWTAKIIGLTAVQYYAAAVTGATITRKRFFGIWTVLLLPVLYAITILPGRQYSVFDLAGLVGVWGTLFVVCLVLLLLIVAMIRGIDERKERRER